ncbi:MAG: hypothetical protein ACRCUA_00065, partial [Fusobacteriaceae bacterium]
MGLKYKSWLRNIILIITLFLIGTVTVMAKTKVFPGSSGTAFSGSDLEKGFLIQHEGDGSIIINKIGLVNGNKITKTENITSKIPATITVDNKEYTRGNVDGVNAFGMHPIENQIYGIITVNYTRLDEIIMKNYLVKIQNINNGTDFDVTVNNTPILGMEKYIFVADFDSFGNMFVAGYKEGSTG